MGVKNKKEYMGYPWHEIWTRGGWISFLTLSLFHSLSSLGSIYGVVPLSSLYQKKKRKKASVHVYFEPKIIFIFPFCFWLIIINWRCRHAAGENVAVALAAAAAVTVTGESSYFYFYFFSFTFDISICIWIWSPVNDFVNRVTNLIFGELLNHTKKRKHAYSFSWRISLQNRKEYTLFSEGCFSFLPYEKNTIFFFYVVGLFVWPVFLRELIFLENLLTIITSDETRFRSEFLFCFKKNLHV